MRTEKKAEEQPNRQGDRHPDPKSLALDLVIAIYCRCPHYWKDWNSIPFSHCDLSISSVVLSTTATGTLSMDGKDAAGRKPNLTELQMSQILTKIKILVNTAIDPLRNMLSAQE